MHNIKNIVKLMRDCFDADKRQQSFWNIFSSKYQHLSVINGDEELLNKISSGYDVGYKYATDIRKTLTAYKREKELIYSSFLLVGKCNNENLSKTICAPLVYFDARLEKSKGNKDANVNLVSINSDQPSINMDVIKQIVEGDIDDFPAEIFFNQLTSNSIEKLAQWFSRFSGMFDTSLLNQFPRLAGKDLITEIKNKKSDKIFVVPFSAFLVVKKSFLSQGVLYELDKISLDSKLLNSLNSFFKPKHDFFQSEDIAPIPAVLSDAQKQVILNAKNYSLSTVIGPPGTGKSFTIAALALEYFMNQKSVLIVSNTEQSISVIEQKLIEQFSLDSQALIRCGDGQHHKKLKNHIDKILNSKDLKVAASSPKEDVHKIASRVDKLEKQFIDKCDKTHGHSNFIHKISSSPKSIIDKIRLALINRYQDKNNHLKEDLDLILGQTKKLEGACISYINYKWQKRVSKALHKNRKHLSNFLVAIRARSSSKQEKFFEETNFNVLLDVLPIWLVSLSNLHRALPLKEDLFDLVIFDESTQCNIASSLPALVRAKSAVIVGDPKQLRHFSFLSREVQSHISQQYQFSGIPAQLNYRDESILDTAQQLLVDNSSISYLDEHFRSHPDIIGYSNQHFYANKLKVMTRKPINVNSQPIEIDLHSGGVCKKGVNKAEAERIIERLFSIIDSQKDINPEHKYSIGVLALFSNQADYLESLVMNKLNEIQILEHKIRVGTAYSFQGEERDIMLISCCVDANSCASNYQYINRDDSFNVGITRARDKQILFTSANQEQILPKSHLAKYIKYCYQVSSEQVAKNYTDAFQADLCNELKKYNIDIKLQFEVASIPVDVVAIYKETIVGIDLIGFPGELSDFITLQSFKLLSRANLNIIPVSYSEWSLNRQKVLDAVLSTLKVDGDKPKQEAKLKTYDSRKDIQFSYLKENERQLSYLLEELDLLDREQDVEFIYNLQNSYINLITVAHIKLKPDSLSFHRFRSLAISIFEQCIENINSIITTTKQVYLYRSTDFKFYNNDESGFSKLEKENDILIHDAESRLAKLQSENLLLLTKINQISAELSKPQISDNDITPLINEIDRHIEVASEFTKL